MSDEDEKGREILSAIRGVARGERPTEGRDEVPSTVRVQVGGGTGSRALHADVIAAEESAGERRLTLAAAEGSISLTFRTKGEWIFSHGDLRVDAPDRASGAAFVAALSRWLGTPLEDATPADVAGAPTAISGSFAKLGVVRDADGTDWDRLKLFLGEGDDHAELFFGIAADGKRVRFSEKWDRYRRPLLGLLGRALGDRRPPAERKVVTIGEGIGARFLVPVDWRVLPQPGHMRVTDPRDDCCLEVSCMAVPRVVAGLPSPAEQLRQLLEGEGHPEAAGRIVTHDRGDVELAWGEYDFHSDDTQRPGLRRLARARTLLAAHDRVQILATFSCWSDDLAWAIPAWERVIDSLEVAAGLDLIPDLAVKSPGGRGGD